MKLVLALCTIATMLLPAPAPQFDQNTLKDYIANGARFDFILVDIRNPEEVKAAIGNASCKPYNLAWPEQLQQEVGKIPKDRHVVVYCQSGGRSRRAAAYLRDAGFSNILDAGGFSTWDGPTVPPSEIKAATLLPEPSMRGKSARLEWPSFLSAELQTKVRELGGK